MFEIPFYPLLKKVLSEKDFLVVEQYLPIEQKEIDSKYDLNLKQKMKEEFVKLKEKIENQRNILTNLEKKLTNFDNTKEKELNYLKNDLEQLNQQIPEAKKMKIN